MKKNIFYICLSLIVFNVLFLNIAKALEFNSYMGFSVLNTYMKAPVKNFGNSKKLLFGLNTGIDFEIDNKFFIAPEFYFNIADTIYKKNVSINDIRSIEIKNTYSLKINFGYNINEKLDIVFLIGKNYFKQNINSDTGYTLSNEKWADSVGFGLGYKINENVKTKLDYECQKLKGGDDNINVHQVKIGLNYNFK